MADDDIDIVSVENSGEGSSQDEADLFSKDTASHYYINKNRLLGISHSSIKDEINGNYILNISRPLPAFDTAMAKAYAITDKKNKGNEDLYALVLSKSYPLRLAEINKLSGAAQKGFANVVDAQLIPSSLGAGLFFVVVLDKPLGVPLNQYVAKNGSVSEDAVIERIVKPINEVISFLARKKVVHGKVNLDNIYIDDSGNVTLGECISEMCGFSQPLLYENIDRATAFPEGKGDGVPGYIDFYALGVCVSIMLRGKNPVEKLLDDEILEKKFTLGTYALMTDGVEISPHMHDFLRGTINNKMKDIWNAEQVREWIKGRKFNLLPPTENIEAGRPIVFAGKKFWNRKNLAHALYLNWDEGAKFVRDDTLRRWVERSIQNADLAEKIEVLAKRTGGKSGDLFTKDDELLAQYILLLDPGGPIRLKHFSVCIDGMGAILAFAYASDKKHYLDSINHIISYSIASYWTPGRGYAGEDEVTQAYMFMIQKCLDFLRKKEFGFGMDRCLYDLNPTLPCQSPVLLDSSIFSTENMLRNLDKNTHLGEKIIDRHIVAFLSSRLELPVRIRVTSLNKFPEFAANVYIQTLALLSLAQETCGIISLPGLAGKVNGGLKNVIEELHSKYVRADMEKNLNKAVPDGDLSRMLNIITDNNFLIRDKLGFSRAVKKYKNNAIQIVRFSNRKAINNVGYRYGLQLSVIISFFFATLVTIVLTLKVF